MSAGLHQIALNKKLTVGNYRLRIHAITTSFYQQSTTPSNMYYSADSSLKIIGVNPTFGVFYNWRIGSECVTNEEVLLYSFCLVNIGEDIFLNEISIFPNPSTGIFNIQFSSQIDRAQIEIRDIQGRIVIHEETIQSANYQLDLSKQPKGVYFIQIRNGEAVLNEKIIVQ